MIHERGLKPGLPLPQAGQQLPVQLCKLRHNSVARLLRHGADVLGCRVLVRPVHHLDAVESACRPSSAPQRASAARKAA